MQGISAFGVRQAACYYLFMTKSTQPAPERVEIRIVRSARRRRTVSARLAEGGTVLEVLAPLGMRDDELAPVIEKLRDRVLRHAARAETASDKALASRAQELNKQFFGGRLRWNEIRYVTNQNKRFGSCTPATRTIRISHRLAVMPAWVRDYVIVHELAHLLEANHGPRFWKLVSAYPKMERARGYLMALGLEEDDDQPAASDVE